MKKTVLNKPVTIFILSLFLLLASVALFPEVTAALFDEDQAIYYVEQQGLPKAKGMPNSSAGQPNS